ncbi:hypothetical protein D9M69_601910 [compost metagenome]
MQHRIELGVGEALERALGAVGSKGVVGGEQCDTRDADAGQVLDGLGRFALVGGAHVEDPGVHRLVQHHGARARPHQRHLVFGEQGQQRL